MMIVIEDVETNHYGDDENDDGDDDNDDPLECAQRVFCDARIVSKVKPWPNAPEIHHVETTLRTDVIKEFLNVS